MKISHSLAYLLVFFLAACHQSGQNIASEPSTAIIKNSLNTEPIEVSIINLIANPAKYDGSKVRVIGYLHLEFEGNCLYLHKEDYEHGMGKNGVWVDLETRSAMDSLRKLSDHYVIVEGIYDDKENGHMSMNSGSLKNISRLDVWR